MTGNAKRLLTFDYLYLLKKTETYFLLVRNHKGKTRNVARNSKFCKSMS